MHKQVCVKVNAYVDELIAPVIEMLSKVDDLVTLESCQDLKGKGDVFITFQCGIDEKNYIKLGKICEKISRAIYGIDFAEVSINWSGTRYNNIPLGYFQFKKADTKQIASALNNLVKD